MTDPPPGQPYGQQPYGQYPPAPPPGPGYGYGGAPNSGHPVQLTIERAPQQSRVLALFSIPYFLARIIAGIPVIIVLYFVGIGAFVVAWIAMWAVLFTGHYPEGMHRFTSGYLRWQIRLSAFVLGLTDKYPGFTMQP